MYIFRNELNLSESARAAKLRGRMNEKGWSEASASTLMDLPYSPLPLWIAYKSPRRFGQIHKTGSKVLFNPVQGKKAGTGAGRDCKLLGFTGVKFTGEFPSSSKNPRLCVYKGQGLEVKQ